MPKHDITVYGAYWCPDCRRSKQFLGEHQIPYHWIDIDEDKEGEAFVIEANNGKRIIPTITFVDGSFLAEPSNAELATKLELKTKAKRNHYDLIILGGGPAGLTAALYTAREFIDTLIIERAAFGGQIAGTERLENMPGFPGGIGGMDLSKRLRRQAERFGVELLQAQEVTGISAYHNYHCVHTGDGEKYSAQSVLIATGSRYRRLDVPGENELAGAGVHFCATCDGPFYKGKRVAVIGGGNSAAEESLLLIKFVEQLTMLVRSDRFKASRIIQEKVLAHPKISVRWHAEVKAFIGEKAKLKGLKVVDNRTGKMEELSMDGAFIFIGLEPNTGFLGDSGVRLNQWGFVVTGHELIYNGDKPAGYEKREPYLMETSIPGIFAAGDVRDKSTKQAASAAGEGASAALMIREYLKRV